MDSYQTQLLERLANIATGINRVAAALEKAAADPTIAQQVQAMRDRRDSHKDR